MRVIQFVIPSLGRRLGIVEQESVIDLTTDHPEIQHVYAAFQAAEQRECSFNELLTDLVNSANPISLSYDDLHAGTPDSGQPYLLPPVDHPDPYHLLITGTGLTHTGSMQSRDQMHSQQAEEAESLTDSARMFTMGVEGGKPESGSRGIAPEWFYKGNGTMLRGHHETLDIPDFARDGGEEPELAGCYIIDRQGIPRRLGFALGNEWSDHETENINYLYLAPSKLRSCAVGPELNTEFDFTALKMYCHVERNGETIYDSGELKTGEQFMCHSLANCEDHHFKYPQHRCPGDMHLHYFGSMTLSYHNRDWKYLSGDEITIAAPGFSAPLINSVSHIKTSSHVPVEVQQA